MLDLGWSPGRSDGKPHQIEAPTNRRTVKHPGSSLGTNHHTPTSRGGLLYELPSSIYRNYRLCSRNHQSYCKAETAFRENCEKLHELLWHTRENPEKILCCLKHSTTMASDYSCSNRRILLYLFIIIQDINLKLSWDAN